MKKRLLLILAIGISFAPAVFAEGTGSFNRSNQASTAGASMCPLAAGYQAKNLDSNDSQGSRKENKQDSTAVGAY